ncbi:hypothetical protein E2C01_040164 [Portunus trituberculatus]|uniref:Uncharacterized protein n=1 Tax=Portunus trituberculatus TaxID=210409 RepID=A0A5B7FN11_PORTR|nr:hypothetical protein [Portunus trituberculatus]
MPALPRRSRFQPYSDSLPSATHCLIIYNIKGLFPTYCPTPLTPLTPLPPNGFTTPSSGVTPRPSQPSSPGPDGGVKRGRRGGGGRGAGTILPRSRARHPQQAATNTCYLHHHYHRYNSPNGTTDAATDTTRSHPSGHCTQRRHCRITHYLCYHIQFRHYCYDHLYTHIVIIIGAAFITATTTITITAINITITVTTPVRCTVKGRDAS